MDCPQCESEGTLTTYTDGEREAVVCEDCGYVGIPADHSGDGDRAETWADAVDRFHETHPFLRDGESPGAETPVAAARQRPGRESSGPVTWDEALRAFGANGATSDGERDADGDARGGATGDDTTTAAAASASAGRRRRRRAGRSRRRGRRRTR